MELLSCDAGVDMRMPSDALLSLHGSGHIEIELNLISSQVHIAQPRCLPGLVLSIHPTITLISQEPRILLIENFLPAADCQVSCHVPHQIGRRLQMLHTCLASYWAFEPR